MKSRIVKRSIVVNGHKTSVSLEDEFWSALKVIAGKRLMNLSGPCHRDRRPASAWQSFIRHSALRARLLSKPGYRHQA